MIDGLWMKVHHGGVRTSGTGLRYSRRGGRELTGDVPEAGNAVVVEQRLFRVPDLSRRVHFEPWPCSEILGD